MQEVVKNGEGFALIREGTQLIEGIITRPIVGVNWTVNTAVVFKRNPKSKLVPVLAKHLKRVFLPSTAIPNDGPGSVKKAELPSRIKKLG
jgi:hypothetical protein